MDKEQLKAKILKNLDLMGYEVSHKLIISSQSKQEYRKIQANSRIEQLVKHKDFLIKFSRDIKDLYPKTVNINPHDINLELIEIDNNSSFDSKLFRWWNLAWWSVPLQKSFGRQMRFILWDKGHDLPFGLIGLQSPILKMSVRDKYLEMPKQELDYWINRSMTAQRLGALPPYNELLGGKMTALTLLSNEIRELYNTKYTNKITKMQNRVIDPNLLFITTTSAFGKSSLYNRLKYKDETVAKSLGYTKGAGSFHISEEVFKDIIAFLDSEGVSTKRFYGSGPSKRVKLLSKAFQQLGIRNYHYHNIKREFFIFELASNLKNIWLNSEEPKYYDRSLNDLYDFWRDRYCLPRAERNNKWKNFQIEDIIDETSRLIEK